MHHISCFFLMELALSQHFVQVLIVVTMHEVVIVVLIRPVHILLYLVVIIVNNTIKFASWMGCLRNRSSLFRRRVLETIDINEFLLFLLFFVLFLSISLTFFLLLAILIVFLELDVLVASVVMLLALMVLSVLVVGLFQVHVNSLHKFFGLRLLEGDSLDFRVGVDTQEGTDDEALSDFHF